MNSWLLVGLCGLFIAIETRAQGGEHGGGRDRDRDRPPNPPSGVLPILPAIASTIGAVTNAILRPPVVDEPYYYPSYPEYPVRPHDPWRYDPSRQFSCVGLAPGYYADIASHCRNFYACTPGGRMHYYQCGERTRFNQYLLICDHDYNYDCRRAHEHFYRNEERRPFQAVEIPLPQRPHGQGYGHRHQITEEGLESSAQEAQST